MRPNPSRDVRLYYQDMHVLEDALRRRRNQLQGAIRRAKKRSEMGFDIQRGTLATHERDLKKVEALIETFQVAETAMARKYADEVTGLSLEERVELL